MSLSYRAPVAELRYLPEACAGRTVAVPACRIRRSRRCHGRIAARRGRTLLRISSGSTQCDRRIRSGVTWSTVECARRRDSRLPTDSWSTMAGWGSTCRASTAARGCLASCRRPLARCWTDRNLSFGMQPITQRAAVRLFLAHASPALRQSYVTDLVSGRAGATIAITEGAGGIRRRAHPGDGSPPGRRALSVERKQDIHQLWRSGFH